MANKDLERLYDTWWEDKHLDLRTIKFNEWVLEKMSCSRGSSLLDVSCGKGWFLKTASDFGLQTTGLDISKVAIDETRKLLGNGANLIVGSGENLPFPEDSFDFATCLGSLEHFEDVGKGVAEISRVLKQNGLAGIFVPNLFFIGHIYLAWKDGRQPSEASQEFSETFYTLKGWIKILETNGLRVVNSFPYNDIFASSKVSPIEKFIYSNLVRYVIPKNLSYAYFFICRKRI